MGKKKDSVSSLGRRLIKDKQKRGPSQLSNRHHVDDGSDWARLNVRSVTEQSTMEEFLTTAQLAATEFTAERENITIVNSNVPTEVERNLSESQEDNKPLLLVPRRPQWDNTTTPEELQQLENDNFLLWRRQLANLQEKDNLILTPFEKNLEFWKQLWRVIERSDVTVQILDARNPLLFLCEDLQKYVKEVSDDKLNVILLNKGDFLTHEQRTIWAKYFDDIGIKAVFFSALQQSQPNYDHDIHQSLSQMIIEENKNPSHLLSNEQLINYFKSVHGNRPKVKDNTVTIGLVGYPNVGKSSTINAILQAKRVSVSATPGKTKHFQTLYVDDELMLCDCPGLVFPNFVSSKAEMIINGILPIDQMTDHVPPVSLITSLIPRHVFESTYSITLPLPHETEDPKRHVTAEELLNAYGYLRGFMTQRGLPDNSRAAKYILKDIVNGKLLYCYAPPGYDQHKFHTFPPSEKHKSSLMTESQKRIMNNTKVSTDDFDKSYFFRQNMNVHSLGVHGTGQYWRLSSNHTNHCGNSIDSSSSSVSSKPWKKHNNRNKREKLRKVYADFDK